MIHQVCTWAIKNLKAGNGSLLCLPMRSKAVHQTADKSWVKREYYIQSCQQKGEGRWDISNRRNLLLFRSWAIKIPNPELWNLPFDALRGRLMRKHNQRSRWRLKPELTFTWHQPSGVMESYNIWNIRLSTGLNCCTSHPTFIYGASPDCRFDNRTNSCYLFHLTTGMQIQQQQWKLSYVLVPNTSSLM